jgi:hypothetical protein
MTSLDMVQLADLHTKDLLDVLGMETILVQNTP